MDGGLGLDGGRVILERLLLICFLRSRISLLALAFWSRALSRAALAGAIDVAALMASACSR